MPAGWRPSSAASRHLLPASGAKALRPGPLIRRFAAPPPRKRGEGSTMDGMSRTNAALLVLFFAVLVWSAVRPHDYFTWFMEVFPAIVGIALIAATHRRFPLTPLLLTLLTLHAIVLMVGGHYTYAEVPLAFWMERAFHLTRN